MIKYPLLFIAFWCLQVPVFSQLRTFDMKSLSEDPLRITVQKALGELSLIITCGKDSIKVDEVVDLNFTRIFGGHFLEVNCTWRVGTNQDRRNTIILCVNKNKLIESMHVKSYSSFDLDEVYDKKTDAMKLFNEHGLY